MKKLLLLLVLGSISAARAEVPKENSYNYGVVKQQNIERFMKCYDYYGFGLCYFVKDATGNSLTLAEQEMEVNAFVADAEKYINLKKIHFSKPSFSIFDENNYDISNTWLAYASQKGIIGITPINIKSSIFSISFTEPAHATLVPTLSFTPPAPKPGPMTTAEARATVPFGDF